MSPRPQRSPDDAPAADSGTKPDGRPFVQREPGLVKRPAASRPVRDLDDRAAAEGERDVEGPRTVSGRHTLDGQPSQPHYLEGPDPAVPRASEGDPDGS